jgi:O-antigen ligase/polysaccharide polymerase Wzy-like membrane protein
MTSNGRHLATEGSKSLILTAFFLGWVTLAFALFNVGHFSITLLMLASCALAVSGFRITRPLFYCCACLLLSGLLAWAIAFLKYPVLEKTFTHMFRSVLAIGVMIGAASIDWDREFPRLRKMLAVIAVIVLGFAYYQLLARKYDLPFAFLPITNLQLATDEGMQAGYSRVFQGAAPMTRVSSFFVEPSRLGRFMLWVFAFGYACRASFGLKLLLMCTGVVGIVLSQSMGGLVGLAFLVSVAILLKHDLRGFILSLVLFGVAFAALLHFAPEEAERVKSRAETIAAMREEHLLQTQRFRDIEDHTGVFMESPVFGHGIASLRKVTDPLSVVGNSFMLLLVERGLIGSLLFFTPFIWCFYRLGLSRSGHDEISQTALFILIAEIYSFATFSGIYFPPSFFALGFAMSRTGNRQSSSAPVSVQARTRSEYRTRHDENVVSPSG